MNYELHSIKHRFDAALSHLDDFYPLINAMWIKSLENINFLDFKENVIKFNQNITYSIISNISIEKVISDAKLYLNKRELERFYLFAKDAIEIKYSHLNNLIEQSKQIEKGDNIILENIFFENCHVGLYCFPIKRIGSNTNFSIDLIKGIEIYFKDFESKIEEITSFLKALPPQQIKTKSDTPKYTAKHYVLAYLFECNAKGESFPRGNKRELEQIGNERIGTGKGNRFYKVFNEIINKDLNAEYNIIEIGGENWRKAVLELSKDPKLVETYLQNKQL